jgi:4-hydroxy-2-oxoheptanedioate aldolase
MQNLLTNAFKTALMERRRQIGFWCTLDGDTSAEVAACSGFDWLLFDTEHTPAADREILRKLQVSCAYPVQPVVRPAWNDRVRIKRLLDIGAQNLLIPYVETAEEAKAAVVSVRYPPKGRRGVAGAMRASRYGSVPDYFAQADESICLLVQIESQKGLENLEEIAAVEGVDGVFIGPADLGANCGLIGPEKQRELRDLIDGALERIAKAGKPSGILSVKPDDIDHYIQQGVTFIAVGVDTAVLASGSRALAFRYVGQSR